jgi:hypothetical protein
MNNRDARARLGHAFGDKGQDLSLSLGELGDGVLSAPTPHQARDDRRIDQRFAINDAPQRINNGCDVEDPLGR